MSAVSERPQWRLRNREETRAIDLEPTFSCDDFSVLQQLALYGLGITQLPDYMGEKHVEDGSLVSVLDHWIGANVDFHALVRSRRGVTPKIRVFLDFMTQSMRLANSPPTRI
jgi:DNA-binding transcriptional LysR family regulator